VTLTFQYCDVTEGRARGKLRAWLDALAAEAGGHIVVAFAIESHRSGAIHVHALIAFSEGSQPVAIPLGEDLWTMGFARIRVFGSGAGGAWYVTKSGNWDLTAGCPRRHQCRRHNGCAFFLKYLKP
jgi:hypothetical protein